MPVTRIMHVDKGQTSGRTYAKDSKGNTLFPSTKTLGETLKAGQYVNWSVVPQTQTIDEKGNLVALETPVDRNIINATFATRDEAIASMAEDKLFDLETEAYAKSKVAELATKYKLDPATFEATI